jgi:hypothetical protein
MSLSNTQILIELCALSYCDEDADPFKSITHQEKAIATDINSGLQQLGLSSDWSITWGPVLSTDIARAFMMYVAGNSSSGEYAVVIRGTDPASFLGWLRDVEVSLVAPPYGSGLLIANGANQAMSTLNAMTSGGQTVVQYLTSLSGSPTFYVTGHSFGGTLATAYAPWLVAQGVGSPQVVTFAAPSAGNAAFVTYLLANVTSVTSYINTLDVVPNLWANIEGIERYYASPGPACPKLITILLNNFAKNVTGFEQPVTPTSLTGTLQSSDTWFQEVGYQHDHNTYAGLLGAPELSIDELEIQTFLATRTPKAA